MENKLIALYGPAGSGKDFFCKALKFIYNKVVAQYYSMMSIKRKTIMFSG